MPSVRAWMGVNDPVDVSTVSVLTLVILDANEDLFPPLHVIGRLLP